MRSRASPRPARHQAPNACARVRVRFSVVAFVFERACWRCDARSVRSRAGLAQRRPFQARVHATAHRPNTKGRKAQALQGDHHRQARHRSDPCCLPPSPVRAAPATSTLRVCVVLNCGCLCHLCCVVLTVCPSTGAFRCGRDLQSQRRKCGYGWRWAFVAWASPARR